MVALSLDYGTWSEVENEATLSDGHLVSVLDQATNNYLQEIFDAVTPYWIGLSVPPQQVVVLPPQVLPPVIYLAGQVLMLVMLHGTGVNHSLLLLTMIGLPINLIIIMGMNIMLL